MKIILTKIIYSTLLILAATLAVPVFTELAAPTFDEDDSTKKYGTFGQKRTFVFDERYRPFRV